MLRASAALPGAGQHFRAGSPVGWIFQFWLHYRRPPHSSLLRTNTAIEEIRLFQFLEGLSETGMRRKSFTL